MVISIRFFDCRLVLFRVLLFAGDQPRWRVIGVQLGFGFPKKTVPLLELAVFPAPSRFFLRSEAQQRHQVDLLTILLCVLRRRVRVCGEGRLLQHNTPAGALLEWSIFQHETGPDSTEAAST